jgi:hypothetical protein
VTSLVVVLLAAATFAAHLAWDATWVTVVGAALGVVGFALLIANVVVTFRDATVWLRPHLGVGRVERRARRHHLTRQVQGRQEVDTDDAADVWALARQWAMRASGSTTIAGVTTLEVQPWSGGGLDGLRHVLLAVMAVAVVVSAAQACQALQGARYLQAPIGSTTAPPPEAMLAVR